MTIFARVRTCWTVTVCDDLGSAPRAAAASAIWAVLFGMGLPEVPCQEFTPPGGAGTGAAFR